MTGYDPAANDWRALRNAAMPGGLGIPWAKKQDDQWLYGLLTGPEHANPAGAVHGGVLMAFADHGLSFLAWEAAKRAPCTTIQLNTHFLDAIKPGEFLELRGEVTRRTRGLVFVRGVIGARDEHNLRDAGAIDGIWRVLRAP
ncbi:MAG TPA: PaaI family thioesterase [Rhodopila sp.]|jgi:acyl-coenzyme A thioesterase PaaI-like protein|nr:PaaI family thioesterase [Rhodopila sp.]